MKIASTSFYDNDLLYFDKISWVKFNNHDKEVILTVSLDEGFAKVSKFFKNVAKFQDSKDARNTYKHENIHYQFVLSNLKYDYFPVKWFDIVCPNGAVLSHDIAFSTTFLKKNNVFIPLGEISFHKTKQSKKPYPKYRELKLKKRAYKIISNETRKVK